MKKLMLFSILLSFLFASCGKKTVFEQRQKFDDLKWNRFKELSFSFDIKDTARVYDMELLFRHHTMYPYQDIFVTLAIFSPSGERRVGDFHLPVRDKNGVFYSQGNGDLWDIDLPLYKMMRFTEPGKYKVEIENRMDKFDTEGVMEVGLRVKEADANVAN
jgi:gliding motility-associated lipoprotein GldH